VHFLLPNRGVDQGKEAGRREKRETSGYKRLIALVINREKMNKMYEGIPTQGKGQEKLLVLLKEAQNKFGYVPEELMAELAESLGLSISEVYGVATFYSFLSTRPQGRNVISVCKCLPCLFKNSQTIIESVERETGIKPGETTPDGKFSFELTNCIGACDEAPAMMLNDEVHVNLTPEKISQILKACK